MTRSRQEGFSIVELLVVIAIIGVVAAVAMPQLDTVRDNNRLRGMAREVSNAFQTARQRAISTGNNQVVYINNFFGIDMCGNALPTDPVTGTPVAMVILDDGPPAGANCCVDAGETFETIAPVQGLNWGLIAPPPPLPADDTGGSVLWTFGQSFTQPNGGPAWWTVFRPDGMPVSAAAGLPCTNGPVGSGGGAVYVNNGRRNYSVVLAPLGGVKVFSWERGIGAWSN